MLIESFRKLLAEVGPLVPCQAITEFDEGQAVSSAVDAARLLLLDRCCTPLASCGAPT
jgi:hypothetical protein